MAKVLYCNDLVPGCKFEARGDSDEEILAEVVDHIATVHGMADISDGLSRSSSSNYNRFRPGPLGRTDRIAKYNQFLCIEEELGSAARFKGKAALE